MVAQKIRYITRTLAVYIQHQLNLTLFIYSLGILDDQYALIIRTLTT